MKIGDVVYSGKAKSADLATQQTCDALGFNLSLMRSTGEFFAPGKGWCKIVFTEDYKEARSPGLPTITLPMTFDAVITQLPAKERK